MGMLLKFHQATSRSREARSASVSAESSAAAGSARSRVHHSDGIEFRCHHLLTVDAGQPISDAKASRVGQISMISRNEAIWDIRDYVGQTVLNCKPISSLDNDSPQRHNVLMVPKIPERERKRGFIQRTREARVRSGLTQEEIATILGIKQGTYKNYETKRYLPHGKVLEFCAATGIAPLELYGPMIPAKVRKQA